MVSVREFTDQQCSPRRQCQRNHDAIKPIAGSAHIAPIDAPPHCQWTAYRSKNNTTASQYVAAPYDVLRSDIARLGVNNFLLQADAHLTPCLPKKGLLKSNYIADNMPIITADVPITKKAKLSMQKFADDTLVAVSDDPALWSLALGVAVQQQPLCSLPVGCSASPSAHEKHKQSIQINARSRRLTMEQKQAVLDMLARGIRDCEIARAVGVTASAIRPYNRKWQTKTRPEPTYELNGADSHDDMRAAFKTTA